MSARRFRTAAFGFVVVVFTVTWIWILMNRLPENLLSGTPQYKLMNVDEITTANSIHSVTGATGRIFEGQRIRVYDGERRFSMAPSSSSSSKTTNDSETRRPSSSLYHPDIHCAKWNVVTTIFAPTESVKRASMVQDWCTVIVADEQTPLDYMETLRNTTTTTTSNSKDTTTDTTKDYNKSIIRTDNGDVIVLLSVQDQLAWIEHEQTQGGKQSTAVGRFLEALPFRHFSRKNIGYLYAIAHGAEIIFDFDDDNLLPQSSRNGKTTVFPPLYDTKVLKHAAMVVTGPKAFNHHSLMGATVRGNTWPRGFPLTQIHNKAALGKIAMEATTYRHLSIPREVGVLQFVADKNPDVDAIHRLVQGDPSQQDGAPIIFHRHVKHLQNTAEGTSQTENYYDTIHRLSTKGSLVVPSHTFVPYNAQSTIHAHGAMFAMLLPRTVHGRVSDIWRSYFSQRIFRDVDTSTANGKGGGDGLKVVILPPDIEHDRSDHSALADMQAEDDLYRKTEALLEFLNQWQPTTLDDESSDSIPARMEAMWIDLYERDYIQLEDVNILQLWLSALAEVGYEFPKPPPPSRRRNKDVVLMGQFNFPRLKALDENNKIGEEDEEGVKKDLLFWYQKWRQRFDKVVLRGPFADHLVNEFQNLHEIDVRSTRKRLFDDKGFVSPMDNLLSTLKQYKDDPTVNGVLYVHDDMLVNTTNVFLESADKENPDNDDSSDRTRTIYATTVDKEESRNSFRIHPTTSSIANNGDDPYAGLYYSTLDGFRSDNSTELLEYLKPWPFNWECMHRFSQVTKDARAKPLLEHDDTNGGEPFLLVPEFQQSDMFYVPTRLTDQYEEIAQLLIDHDVFLECGFPKIADFLLGMPPTSPLRQQKQPRKQKSFFRKRKDAPTTTTTSTNDVSLKSVDLCTSWDYNGIRGTRKMIAQCRSETYAISHRGAPLAEPYSVIHPFKLKKRGYQEWDRSFDYITTGSTVFELEG